MQPVRLALILSVSLALALGCGAEAPPLDDAVDTAPAGLPDAASADVADTSDGADDVGTERDTAAPSDDRDADAAAAPDLDADAAAAPDDGAAPDVEPVTDTDGGPATDSDAASDSDADLDADVAPDVGPDATPPWDPAALGLPPWVREHDPLTGGEPCTDDQRRLVAPFIAPDDIQYIIPIGWVANMAGHILPAGHQIVVQEDQVTVRAISAAQSGVVFAFQASLYDADDPVSPTAIDAFIDVRVCRGFSYGYFHVSALSEALSAWVVSVVASGAATCEVATFPEGPGRICRFRAAPHAEGLPTLAAGDVVGHLGGVYVDGELVQGSAGVELGVTDLLAPPQVMDATRQGAYRHAVCPLDAYPSGALRDAYYARLEPESGATCGTVALSVAGTAAGFWWSDVDAFIDPFDVTDQDEALTLVRAARRPDEQVIATGVQALGLGNHAFFTPRSGAAGAAHNPPLETVTSASGVHCFDGFHTQVNVEATGFELGHYFLALTGPDASGRPSLLLERVATGPCPDTATISAHTFGASAVRFQRPAPQEPIP